MPWVIPAKPECYLRMFPDPPDCGRRKGHVFKVSELDLKALPEVQSTLEQWEKCWECYYYKPCYDFGLARLLLFQVAGTERGVTPAGTEP